MKKFEDMNNKEFIFSCLNKLKNANKLTENVISVLTSSDECHNRFNCSSGFAILMEVPTNCTEDELRKLCSFAGIRRYYQDRYVIDGRTFVVENHWYGPNKSNPDNRTPFLIWVNSLTKTN